MHNPSLRLEFQPHLPRQGRLRTGSLALCKALVAGMALLSFSALADVYSELNEKINSAQWGAAQSLIAQQLQKQPADPQIRLMQSQMQAAQGQTAQAMATLQALTQEFPELPEPYNNLAVLLASQQRYEEALAALRLAVRARPDYGLALENLGDVHAALARQSYLQSQKLPAQDPYVGARLTRKIQLTGQLLQAAQP